MLHDILRTVNRLNPSSRGKHRVMSLARRYCELPRPGVHSVGRGLRMHLRLDQFMDRSIYFYACDPCLSRLLLNRLKRGGTFVDVGANIGYYTLAAAATVGPEGRVFAFDPQPAIFQRLRENVRLNGLENVRLYECALSDKSEELTFYVPPETVGFGHASLREQDWMAAEKFQVHARPLDDLLSDEIDRLDLMKIDAEGAEVAILKGARRTIQRFQPDLIVELNAEAMERFGYSTMDLIEYITDCNRSYCFQRITGHRPRPVSLSQLRQEQPLHSGDLLAYVP